MTRILYPALQGPPPMVPPAPPASVPFWEQQDEIPVRRPYAATLYADPQAIIYPKTAVVHWWRDQINEPAAPKWNANLYNAAEFFPNRTPAIVLAPWRWNLADTRVPLAAARPNSGPFESRFDGITPPNPSNTDLFGWNVTDTSVPRGRPLPHPLFTFRAEGLPPAPPPVPPQGWNITAIWQPIGRQIVAAPYHFAPERIPAIRRDAAWSTQWPDPVRARSTAHLADPLSMPLTPPATGPVVSLNFGWFVSWEPPVYRARQIDSNTGERVSLKATPTGARIPIVPALDFTGPPVFPFVPKSRLKH
jgi:hypothetical protein